jgi:succinyl-CoA synthetase beta subunit
MKLLEYQSKKLLKRAGLPVPRGIRVESAEQVLDALRELGISRGVVKAQAFTGGRGKAGGIRLFTAEQQAIDFTRHMIGMQLVTNQTGPLGAKILSVLLEEALDISEEFYVAILFDRGKVNPVIMLSPDGGVDIEEVAANTPERILSLYPEYGKPLSDVLLDRAATFLGLEGDGRSQLCDVLQKLYTIYLERDAVLLEINPLLVTTEGKLYILDCKLEIDDNAIFRQLDSGGDANADKTQAEIEAGRYGMTYISLTGNIGCMVNGAGLAMATMDSIKNNGGDPANFLDVGGSASEEAVSKAIKIISSDQTVDCILVNIFGGIMRCDTIANGIVSAVGKSGLKVPLVVRLEGTNVETGKKIIADSGLNIISASDLDDAARKAVLVTIKT